MNKNLLHDESTDKDFDYDINSIINGISDESLTPEQADSNINLSQFEDVLRKVLQDVSPIKAHETPPVNEIPDEEEPVVENILDSEFKVNDEVIDYLENKVEAGSYQNTIDPVTFKKSEAIVDDYEDAVEDYDDEEGEYEEYMTEDESDFSGDYEAEEDEVEAITANGIANINGQPVQIILTGVMITPAEIRIISEAAKKEGLKLNKVEGAGNIIHFVMESKSKSKFIIKYDDLQYAKTKTPFSLDNNNFRTLNEVFSVIKNKEQQIIKESKFFEKLVSKKGLEKRRISDVKESTILKEFEGKISDKYMHGWNVKSVGALNLKSGLNEVYSDVTKHTKEPNTLIKTNDGKYYLIKGNLKERSKKGTKRQIVDIPLKKDFGIGTVIGVYENNINGLGEIMFETKRTSISLLAWR